MIRRNDQKIANEGRKGTLPEETTDGVEIKVPLREQIVQNLINKLRKDKAGEELRNIWTQANNNRTKWLKRQQAFLEALDEMIDPIYPAATDWSSNIHLPTILTICKTFHARFYQALLGLDPPFTVKARKEANVERAELIQELMRYTVREWANGENGIDSDIDSWLWSWVTRGRGILKTRWEREFTKFKDVEEVEVPVTREVVLEDGSVELVPDFEMQEVEVDRVITKIDGPCVENISLEDVIIVGGEGDPQKADYVFHQDWLTASQLYQLVDQGIFDAKAVKKVIKSGEDMITNDQEGSLKMQRDDQGGMAQTDKEWDIDRYKVVECYLKWDVDGSGIASDIVVWFHPDSGEILRATYLHRIIKSGQVPFSIIDFHRRQDTDYPAGLVEMVYSIAKEIDAMHNINIDIGILSSLPWGYYKPTTSSLKSETMPVTPGSLIPLDNPGQDVFFPNLGNRVSFGFQEQAALQNQIERLTSISDLNLGVISGQGATRTATGTRALLGESNANLDIYLQRMNRGWKRTLKNLFAMVQEKLPPGFTFRVFGDDGNQYFVEDLEREEIKGMYDFEVEPNSANSNKQIQIEAANLAYQLTGNPIDLQLGIVSPVERYNALVNLLKVNGFKDFSKFVRKPQNVQRMFTPEEIANRVLSGIDVFLDPTQDLQGFVEYVQEIISNDDLLGQFSQFEVAALVAKQREAAQLQQAVQSAEAQAAAAQQQQLNAMASQVPGNAQPVNVTGQGEG